MTILGVLSNPNSGGRRAGHGRVRAVADAGGVRWASSTTAEEVPGILRAMAAEGVDTLAVDGGDATLDSVIAALRTHGPFAREPDIIALRGGSSNMVHGDVGMPGRPDRALGRVLAALDRGAPLRVVERRPLRLELPSGAVHHGFFFGTAAIPRAIDVSVSRLHRLGLPPAVADGLTLGASVLRLISGRVARDPVLHPDRVRAHIGEAWERDEQAVALIATTLDRLILGVRPAPPDGAIGVAALAWPLRARLGLPWFLAGRGASRPDLGRWRARTERLTLWTAAACTLDGEVYPGDPDRACRLWASDPVHFRVV